MRTKIKFVTIIGAMLLAIGASGAALAQHGGGGGGHGGGGGGGHGGGGLHGGGYGHGGYGHGGYGYGGYGLYLGAPFYSPWDYPSPYYTQPYSYYPRAAASAPPIYIEQGDSDLGAPAPQAPQYWYYCNASKAYYPYVKECPGGWQRVAPQPG